MNSILNKLQSKRGASIMLALILFLVCVLAGTAAITAASANMGRLSYMRDAQQQYLAVSSAARLVRDRLDGMEISCEYEFDALSWVNPSVEVPAFTIAESIFVNGLDTPEYYVGGIKTDDPGAEITKYFMSRLEKMNYYEFYQRVKNEPNGVPWGQHIGFEPNMDELLRPIELTVVCDEIRDSKGNAIIVDVKVDIDYTKKAFTLTVSQGDELSVSAGGRIMVEAEDPDDDMVSEPYEEIDPADNSVIFSGIFNKVKSSRQKTAVRFVVDDAFART